MTKIIGIDLGTSNSAAAVVMGGKPTIIPAAEGATVGGKAFPSVVAFGKDGELLVGNLLEDKLLQILIIHCSCQKKNGFR